MKRFVLSLLFVAVGAAGWVVFARAARFSIKKWDAKFGTVLRHQLNAVGLRDEDVVASLHEVRQDRAGDWIRHRMTLPPLAPEKRRLLEKELRRAGAAVEWRSAKAGQVLVVRRGGRVYQEITFQPRR